MKLSPKSRIRGLGYRWANPTAQLSADPRLSAHLARLSAACRFFGIFAIERRRQEGSR